MNAKQWVPPAVVTRCALCGEVQCTKLCLEEQDAEDEYRREQQLIADFEDAQCRSADERIEWLKEGW